MHDAYTKAATDAEGREALRAEESMLRTARHPGVVEVESFTDDADRTELRLSRVHGLSLAARGLLPSAEVAGIGTHIARTLADLHSWGVTHGRIDATHILIGAGGRPVLAGLRLATCKPQDSAAQRKDVCDLATALREAIASEPQTGHRIGKRSSPAEGLRATLTRIESNPPLAADAAEAIANAVPHAALPSGGDSGARSPEPATVHADSDFWGDFDDQDRTATNHRRLASGLGLATAAFALLIWPVGLATRSAPSTNRVFLEPTELAAPVADDAISGGPEPEELVPLPTPPLVATSDVAAASENCAPPSANLFDITGDGCGESVVVMAGLVETQEQRWRVAGPGDVVVLGDWNCDGIETPAVLRHPEAQVVVFSEWADDATAQPVPMPSQLATSPAVDITRELHPALPCHRLLVADQSGAVHTIDVMETH